MILIVIPSLFILLFCRIGCQGNDLESHHKTAKDTYSKVLPCLLSSGILKEHNHFHLPRDAESHFKDIFEKTAKFRNVPVHGYFGYSGPWIENHFIAKYSKHQLSFFRGFIPIFVQWVDTQLAGEDKLDELSRILDQVLRPDVIYLTISQVRPYFEQYMSYSLLIAARFLTF